MPAVETIARVLSLFGEPRIKDMASYFDHVREFGENARFRELDRHEAYFRGKQHELKQWNWDGRRYTPRDELGPAYQVPAVMGGPANQAIPWYLRRPYVRVQLCQAIVARFTGLLFGEDKCPKIQPPDPKVPGADWIKAALKASNWWSQCAEMRDMGGAVGAVVAGVELIEGRPFFEVLNAKHCTPQWVNGDAASGILESLEVLFKRPKGEYVDRKDERTGKMVTVWEDGPNHQEWYRRLITKDADVVMTRPVKSKDAWTVESEVQHNLGFVPFVWIVNEKGAGNDGAPDCDEQWDNMDAIDALFSDGFVGTHYNSDPTLWIKTKDEIGTVRTGSHTTIHIKGDGDACGLLELAGSGGKAAIERALEIRDAVLEATRCVLQNVSVGMKTATEVEKLAESMLERADGFRRRYGDAVERLFEMLLTICRANQKGLVAPLNKLPMPPEDDIEVVWPPKVQPTAEDDKLQVEKWGAATAAGFASRKTATEDLVRKGALDIPNLEEEEERLAAEKAERAAEFESKMDLGKPGVGMAPGYGGGDIDKPEAPRIKLLAEFGEIRIWLVDGEAVRNEEAAGDDKQIRFVHGAHDLVYPDLIPEGEVWIDSALEEAERPFVVTHEVTERALMAGGMEYESAHEIADAAEAKARENPESVATLIGGKKDET